MTLRAALFFSFSIIPGLVFGQTNVVTQHNDLGRTGWYDHETVLNTRNVKPGVFGKLFSRDVDDQLYAQLLLVHTTLPGVGLKNIVIAATVNNSIYAFDADSANVSQPYWHVNLTPPGSRPVRNNDMTGACGGGYFNFSGNIGIVGTPVIDLSSLTLFVVTRSVDAIDQFSQHLHALDVTTGLERPNSPVLIAATINGNGEGSVNGVLSFEGQKHNQRSGLLLLNNTVYIAWASHCVWRPFHGWIMGYDATTLQQNVVYNTTPEGYAGGIWMCGSAPSADPSGNIYIGVGNGSAGKNGNLNDLANRSESAIKFTRNGSSLAISSFFTPKNYDAMEANDLDFGTTQIMLIPNSNRAVAGCKGGELFLLDRDNMGGFDASANHALQDIDLGRSSSMHATLAYYRGSQKEWVYAWSENALLKAFPYSRQTNLLDFENMVSSPVQGPVGNSGAFLSVSSNGVVDSTAILWATHAATGDATSSVRQGILRAFDATDVTRELWNSSVYQSDKPGNYAKYNSPVIANGKVYIGTFSNKLIVYGLLNKGSVATCGAANTAVNKTYAASSAVGGNAENAFDGVVGTAWLSDTGNSQWISVDLGGRYDLCHINLTWGQKIGVNFSVEVSDDNLYWKSLVNISGNSTSVLTLPVDGTGRWVRVIGTTGQNGYSLAEFEIQGTISNSQCGTPVLFPSTNIYEASASLNWLSDEESFVVQYKTPSAENWNQRVVDSCSISLTGLSCGTDYLFRVRKVCGSDSSAFATGSFSTIPCNQNCGLLPASWSTQDIGNVEAVGSACFQDGEFTLRGSGNDQWDKEDAFRFAYKPFAGDGEIETRVSSVDLRFAPDNAGIMFRESLTPVSPYAFFTLSAARGATFRSRDSAGMPGDTFTTPADVVAPYWLKLTKLGSSFTAFYSPDGSTWTQLGNPVDLGFGNDAPVYAGLALNSNRIGFTFTGSFENVFMTGSFEYELQSLEANLNLDKTVTIQWATTIESNIQQFILERKTTGNYEALDTFPAVNLGDIVQDYHYQDISPPAGKFVYYRVKMISREGTVRNSAPVGLWISSSKSPVIYPNPAPAAGSQSFYVAQGDTYEPVKFINVFDINGRFLTQYTNTGTTGITEIPISGAANGIYIVEIITNRSRYRTKLTVRN